MGDLRDANRSQLSSWAVMSWPKPPFITQPTKGKCDSELGVWSPEVEFKADLRGSWMAGELGLDEQLL